jgi:zinc protease
VFSFVDADPFVKGATFVSAAMCAPQNAKKALTGLLEELTKLIDKGLPDPELKEHKKAFQARFDNDLTNDEVVTMLLDRNLVTGRTLAFDAEQNKKVQALAGAEVTSTLKKYVKPEALIKIRAGDLN